MVQYQRYNPLKKGVKVVLVESQGLLCGNSRDKKRARLGFCYLLFISLVSCSLILAPQLSSFPSNFSQIYSPRNEDHESHIAERNIIASAPLCSSIPNGTICCDRKSIRTDVCIMKGDVRTSSQSSSVYLYLSRISNGSVDYSTPNLTGDSDQEELRHEKIKPYTRKWEKSTMDTIDELHLISKRVKPQGPRAHHECDIRHEVPAVFFSTGGYTGNVYHEFNDGILPLYITSQHFRKRVVFVILEYHEWWFTKYGDILSLLSDYPPIDFSGDNRTHCFPEAIVGLRIHDELAVDSALVEGGKTIRDFRGLLEQAYRPRVRSLEKKEKHSLAPLPKKKQLQLKKPKLVILSRNGSRAITNQGSLVKMAESIGYEVVVLRPDPTLELAKVYRSLNSSDVMIGVHGAAMTHFLFLRPGCVLIQVIPLGTEWAAKTYYGDPAMKLGLKYIGYKIFPRESSLFDVYDKDDPVLTDPSSMSNKGWEFTKKIYLENQNVRLNLARFRKQLVRAYEYSLAKKDQHLRLQTKHVNELLIS